MARPMGSQDTLGNHELDMGAFTPKQPSQESPIYHENDSDAFEGWNPTPPRDLADPEDVDVSHEVADRSLRALLGSPTKGAIEEVNHSQTLRRSITPSPSQSQSPRKRRRSGVNVEKKNSSGALDSPDYGVSRDGFGLKSLLSQIPTKEERAESQKEVVLAQERMTNHMTEAMSNIITSNRAMEIAAKKELAAKELQYKTRLARGNMVVELIRAGRSPEEARSIAQEEFPEQ